MLKYTFDIYIKTTYNDGAGNTCCYYYKLNAAATNIVTKATTQIWTAKQFIIKRAKTALSMVGTSRDTIVGAPPAANARTLAISATGVWTLGANETFTMIYVDITLLDVDDHPYTSFDVIVAVGSPGFASLIINQNGNVLVTKTDAKDESVSATADAFYETADYIEVLMTPSTIMAADKQLQDISVTVVETDLIQRPYDGKYIEGGLKAVIVGMQLKAGKEAHYEGALAQVADYIRSKRTPIDLVIPTSVNNVIIGADQL